MPAAQQPTLVPGVVAAIRRLMVRRAIFSLSVEPVDDTIDINDVFVLQ